MTKTAHRRQLWIAAIVSLVLIYLVTHLLALTKLPVFADEAIYIRWAQLIMDDARRYLFFPLNDGKTPFFVWSLVPFQYLFQDQLFSARLVSLLIGILQMFVSGGLVYKLTKSRLAGLFGMFLVIILPFWFFYHRMALMDGMLTFWLSLSFFALVMFLSSFSQKVIKLKQFNLTTYFKLFNVKEWLWLLAAAFSLGFAFWTKLPAVLFIPGLFFWPLVYVPFKLAKLKKTFRDLLLLSLPIAGMVFLGVLFFFLLKLHPAFSQLFGRGGDFLFTPSEFLHEGVRFAFTHAPGYFQALSYYLTPFVLFAPLIGMILKPHRKLQLVLFLSSLSFALPIFIFGKVVYPRYFLPLAIFATVAYAVLILDLVKLAQTTQNLTKKALLAVVLALILANTVSPTLAFFIPAYTNVNNYPFVKVDKVQYLSSWSAGNGIKEVTEKLLKEADQKNRIALATEGYFGTLPDGVLMYLHGKDVTNLYVEGIGQPVNKIPASFIKKAKNYDKVWLLVNSNRLKMDLPKDKLLKTYCRLPDPKTKEVKCLTLWDISDLVHQYANDSQTF